LLRRAGTPDAIVKRLETEIVAFVKDPAISKLLTDRGFEPVGEGADARRDSRRPCGSRFRTGARICLTRHVTMAAPHAR
jgi:hypothetical protein